MSKLLFKGKHKGSHKGSTLLMVIICLAFLGILGSLMLSVSMVNYQMKRVQNSSKSNFYLCEKALEEIQSGLEEKTISAIREEYELVLKKYVNYSVYSEEDRDKIVRIETMDRLLATLDPSLKRDISDDDYKNFRDNMGTAFLSYLSDSNGYAVSLLKGPNVGWKPLEVDKSTSFSLLFTNVRITYQGDQNYETSITTDIRITIPSFTFTEGDPTVSYSMEQPYQNYALAADDDILSVNAGSATAAGSSLVNGNVYAGNMVASDNADGILVSDTNTSDGKIHKLSVTGDTVTTRGNIIVRNSADLRIGSSTNTPLLWADGLFTDAVDYSPSTLPTRLNLNAICLIKDDLTLQARNSSVNLSGAYLGYTSANTPKGSAIIVNGAGSSLNLKELSSLLLAGRAFVSTENDESEVMTGESLSLKSDQNAYLVPGADIKLVSASGSEEAKHNPITYDDLYEGNISKQRFEQILNIDLSYLHPTETKDYLKVGDQYQLISKQTTLGEQTFLHYYYLNFASGRMADQYLADYMNKFPLALQPMDAFPLGEVLMPTDPDVFSVGNLMSCVLPVGSSTKLVNRTPGLSLTKSGTYATDAALNQALRDMKFTGSGASGTVLDSDDSIFASTVLSGKTVADLPDIYDNMIHYLYPEKTSAIYGDGDAAVAPTIRRSGIDKVIADNTANSGIKRSSGFIYSDTYSSPVVGENYLVVTKNDVTITGSFQGILITTGDVNIDAGAIINGMIVAAGTATTPGDITVGDKAIVKGRLIATGDITLGEECSVDCKATFDYNGAAVTAEEYLKQVFMKEKELLWNIFANPTGKLNLPTDGSMGLVDIDNLVTSENWRNY